MKLKLNTNIRVPDGQWIAALGIVPTSYIDLCANSTPSALNTCQHAVSVKALWQLHGLAATVLEVRHKNFIKVRFDVPLVSNDFECDTFWINSILFEPYELSSIDKVLRDIRPVGDWLDDQLAAVKTIQYILDNADHFSGEVDYLRKELNNVVKK